MNRLMLFVLVAALGAPITAAAQSTDAAAPATANTELANVTDEEAAKLAEAKAKPADQFCLRDTGSRIRATDRRPCTAIGRTYSRDDMYMTGENDIGSALRKLDPAIR
jgi:hypothetical protein